MGGHLALGRFQGGGGVGVCKIWPRKKVCPFEEDVRAACLQNEIAPEKLLNRYEKRFEKREKGSEKRSETRLKIV